MIFAEGVDSLSTKELQSACQSRGIRFSGVSPARLREELEQWIELHYTNGVSGVLLILSRAFNFEQKGDDVMNSLVITLGSLPENLVSHHLNQGPRLTYRSTKPSSTFRMNLHTNKSSRSSSSSKSSSRTKKSRRW